MSLESVPFFQNICLLHGLAYCTVFLVVSLLLVYTFLPNSSLTLLLIILLSTNLIMPVICLKTFDHFPTLKNNV